MSELINEKINVYIRQRPNLSSDELDVSAGGALEIEDSMVVYKAAQVDQLSESLAQSHAFKFNGCFTPASQMDIFDISTKPIIMSALEGYSGTIFAYGPTNSGKTYTMRGNAGSDNNNNNDMEDDESKGIMQRSMELLIDEASKVNGEIWVSYIQIYCEAIHDLLGNNDSYSNSDLQIREKEGKVFVENAVKHQVKSVSDFLGILYQGDENRVTAETNMNEASSRSHTALTVHICIPEMSDESGDSNQPTSIKESTLIMVDLAGSERANASEGLHFKRTEEAKSINLSLTSLGNCMNALATGRKHIPYRDSKLTRLLQGSLGVGARTSVVVTLPPNHTSAFNAFALSALRFANRAMKVQVNAKVSRSLDYKSLYVGARKRLEEYENMKEKENRSAEKQQDQIFTLINNLEEKEEEIKALKAQLDTYAKADISKGTDKENTFVTGGIDTKSSNADSNSNGNEQNEKYWRQQIQVLTDKHLEELRIVHDKSNKQIDLLKKHVDKEKKENETMRKSLAEERENHLNTVQSLKEIRKNSNNLEDTHHGRIAELLAEISESYEVIESRNEEITRCRTKMREMDALLVSQQDSVPKEKFDELQTLFVETVERLGARVGQLEDAPKNPQDKVNSNVYLPSVQPGASSRGASNGLGGGLRGNNKGLSVKAGNFGGRATNSSTSFRR